MARVTLRQPKLPKKSAAKSSLAADFVQAFDEEHRRQEAYWATGKSAAKALRDRFGERFRPEEVDAFLRENPPSAACIVWLLNDHARLARKVASARAAKNARPSRRRLDPEVVRRAFENLPLDKQGGRAAGILAIKFGVSPVAIRACLESLGLRNKKKRKPAR
jgi:hypothetical protein